MEVELDQINIFEHTRRVRERFSSVRTSEQYGFIDEWCARYRMFWGVFWNTRLSCTILRTIRTPDQNGLDGRCCYVPFDENSTSDDVQKFIDQLIVADVHNG